MTLKIISFLAISFSLASCTSLPKNSHVDASKLSLYKGNYQKLISNNWPKLTASKIILPKQKSKLIPELRKRLVKLGDLSQSKTLKPLYYDKKLVNGIKHFQYRHGLKPDGIIGQSTLTSLNRSPKQRFTQLQQAIKKWQQLPKSTSSNEYIHVNLASYQLNIFKGKQNTLKMKVVVGNPNWPTPTLKSEIQTVVVNPSWNIPRNITEKEIIHKISNNLDYLDEEHIKILDGWHKGAKQIDPTTIDWEKYASDEEDLPYRLMQGSGEHNALGKIKFTFPNKEHVYLHDTPNKGAFSLTKRNLSHGCIRLEKPIALLNYLFEHKNLNRQQTIEQQLIDGGKTRHYALKTKLALYISRIDAWVDNQGLLHFSD